MITKKTVFILGAGASCPFGFPLGKGLMQNVYGIDVPTHEDYKQLREMGFSDTDITSFRETLRRSGHTSLDAFLGYRTEFIPVGKAVIAQQLIRHETPAILFSPGSWHGTRNNWYEILLNKMDSEFEDWHTNNVIFVTFNYDRSLEHYLFTTLVNRYPRCEDDIAKTLRRISFIHVHGCLGLLPWQNDSTAFPVREYDNNRSIDNIRKAAEGIKIICEIAKSDMGGFQQAQLRMMDAEVFFFIGFGYLKQNMERLSLPFGAPARADWNPSFYGSAYGLTAAQCDYLRTQYRGLTFGALTHQADEFLTNSHSFWYC